MTPKQNPPWAELIQLLPILTLALPLILSGEVDLSQARLGFLIGAGLTLPVSTFVLRRGHLLNPILIGTAAWLWLGAAAFGLGLSAPVQFLTETQASGLFAGALIAGLSSTFSSPQGYIAVRVRDVNALRKASLILVGVTALCLVWSFSFRHDVRLGGGLPFIVTNVARRLLGRRLIQREQASASSPDVKA